MIKDIITFILIMLLAIYVIVEIVKHPFRKCENPRCDICPFPNCNCDKEIEDEWSD